MSICQSFRRSFVLRGQPAVPPFLAPAVYAPNWPKTTPSGKRFITEKQLRKLDEWGKRKAQGKYEARITRRGVESIRKNLETDSEIEENSQNSPQNSPDMPRRPAEATPNPENETETDQEQGRLFGDIEVQQARKNMELTISQSQSTRECLSDLKDITRTGKRIKDVDRLYLVEEASRIVEEESRAIEDQIQMLKADRKLRDVRRHVRWLLDAGRTKEGIRKQYATEKPEFMKLSAVFAYLIMNKRNFRLSRLLIEALSSTADSFLVSKAFHVLVKEHLGSLEKRGHSLDDSARRIMQMLSNIREDGRLVLSPVTMHFLAKKVPLEILNDTFWLLHKMKNGKLSDIVCLQFISFLLRTPDKDGLGKWEEAFEILKDMKARGRQLEEMKFQGVVLRVLEHCLRSNHAESSDEILNFMADLGWQIGTPVHNIILARAAKRDDADEVIKNFRTMLQMGQPPNDRTYLILHNFWKQRSDFPQCGKVLADALFENPSVYLITDILHKMVLQDRPYVEVYSEFSKYFSVDMPRAFSIDLRLHRQSKTKSLATPDHVTMAVLFTSYIQTCTLLDIWTLYQTYRTYLYTQRRIMETPIRKMLLRNGSYFPHIIMLGLGSHPGGLPLVARVLEDMLRPSAHVRSDVYSWSIFVHLLSSVGKLDEARRAVTVMRRHGLAPNVVTWTALLTGYVREQEGEEAVRVRTEMEEDGVKPNRRTWGKIIRAEVLAGNDWRAGDAFRQMMDECGDPDEHMVYAVSKVKDRLRFEAGLAGESEESDSMFEDGELSYPKLQSAEEFERELAKKGRTPF